MRIHSVLMVALMMSLNPRPLSAFYISHAFLFPNIPYSAGVYHIHSPTHFMEAHGFALPGFKILETRAPQSMGNYITAEFLFETYFCSRMSAKVFSSARNSSHVLVMDPNGTPCLLGRLSLSKCGSTGHTIRAHADLLRPANGWERLLGGKRLVKPQSEVERSIKLGYSDFKNDLNLNRYVNMVMECDQWRNSEL